MEGGKTPVGMINELINILSIERKDMKIDTPGKKPGGTKDEGNIDMCIYVYIYVYLYIYVYYVFIYIYI
jgi:hypothetical protein